MRGQYEQDPDPRVGVGGSPTQQRGPLEYQGGIERLEGKVGEMADRTGLIGIVFTVLLMMPVRITEMRLVLHGKPDRARGKHEHAEDTEQIPPE